MLTEASVLPCRRPNLTPHPVHDVPGVTKKHGVHGLVVVVACLVVVVDRVVINDGGVVIVNDVTYLAHCRAVIAIIYGGSRRGGRCGGTHLCFFVMWFFVVACVHESARVLFLLDRNRHCVSVGT